MKSFVFLLVTWVVWSGISHGADADAKPEIPLALKPLYRVPEYDVGLVRAYGFRPEDKPFSAEDSKTKEVVQRHGLCSFFFNIVDKTNTVVGALNTQWIPDPVAYFKSDYYGHTPMLRIANISIGPGLGDGRILCVFNKNHLQKKSYGTQAMEALLVALRKSDFPETMRICLECPTYCDHLPKWYQSFGFKNISTPPDVSAEYVQYMAVIMNQAKFPLYKKMTHEE